MMMMCCHVLLPRLPRRREQFWRYSLCWVLRPGGGGLSGVLCARVHVRSFFRVYVFPVARDEG